MNALVIFFVLLAIPPCPTHAGENALSADWFHCAQDSDCVDINYSCAGAVVNRKFIKEAITFYRNQNATRDCVQPRVDESKLPAFKVFCEKGTCRKLGRNPKTGFS